MEHNSLTCSSVSHKVRWNTRAWSICSFPLDAGTGLGLLVKDPIPESAVFAVELELTMVSLTSDLLSCLDNTEVNTRIEVFIYFLFKHHRTMVLNHFESVVPMTSYILSIALHGITVKTLVMIC